MENSDAIKAKELIEGFAENIRPKIFGEIQERDWDSAKDCALFHCDELIKIYKDMWWWDGIDTLERVKTEIEKY